MVWRVAGLVVVVATSLAVGGQEEEVRCAERRMVYMEGRCLDPLTRGPCGAGEVVVAGGGCKWWPCEEEEVGGVGVFGEIW